MSIRYRLCVGFLLFIAATGLLFGGAPAGKGTVSGTVVEDSSGTPLREAVVKFFNPHSLWVSRVHTDSAGQYEALLGTGRYLVRAEKFGYVGEWFDNAVRLQDAFVVTVHEDSGVTADFALQPVPIRTPVSVHGTVYDSASSVPLQNAFVAFMHPHRWLRDLYRLMGFLGGDPAWRPYIPGLGRLHGVEWFGFTNASGEYEAHLRANQPYVAVAFKPGYLPQFFQHKVSPLDANRLVFSGDSNGIDFDLVQNPVAVNTVSGMVADSTGVGVPSHVVLIRLRAPLPPVPVRYQATDSLGQFSFDHVAPGRFLVRAIPLEEFAPAWFNSNACGVRSWRNAEVVNVSGNVSGVNVCVKPVQQRGFARLAGQLSGGTLSKNTRSPLSAAGVSGVVVYAVSASTQEIAGYDVTEDDGSFAIEDLEAGSYQVVADIEGYSTNNPPTHTLDETNGYEVTDGSVNLSSDPVLGVGDESGKEVPRTFHLEQNYPNPFNPSTVITMHVPKQSMVTLTIYNVIGQQVAQLVGRVLEPGIHSVQWNGTDDFGGAATTGVYLMKMTATPLSDDSEEYSQIRKMILMK